MKSLYHCPVCKGTDFNPFLECRDYTVSHETFQLVCCTQCGFVFTNPQPDNRELPRYYESDDYISHSDKSQNLTAHLYKLSRTYTLKWKYHLIRKYSIAAPSSILDFGCGTGSFLRQCVKHGMTGSGVEPSKTARQEAKAGTNASIADHIEKIQGSFDVITLWHVLEHVSDLQATLSSLKDRLSKSGTIFIAVPNHKSLDAQIYKQYWAAYDVPRHLWHFTRTTMERTLADNDLKLEDILPMKLDAYYVSLLSEKYKTDHSGIPALATAFLNGWKSNRAAKATREYSSLIYIARK